MAGKNPDPERISEPLWQLWVEFDALEPSALLGGILALKPGYHSYASRLKSSDYSIEDVAADRRGSRSKSSAIDLTMSSTAMAKYSIRLDNACRRRDARLFIDGTPILREFIGTKNGRDVYCWVLIGGRALGVGADAGPDPGRDKSHLWHIHLSIIRQFCESADAMDRIFSVLSNETLEEFYGRHPSIVPSGTTTRPSVPAKPATKPTPQVVHRPGSRVLQYVPGKPLLSGADVVYVQRFIGPKWMGAPDAKAGATFRAGVKKYQSMRGLKADGVVGAATWRSIGVANRL